MAVIGSFLAYLDISVVNVGVAAMQNEFGAGTTDIEWIITVYSLTVGVVIPASAWLGERFGLARVWIWSMAVFAIASVLCGVAWDLPSMIIFRVLQAVPGAIIPTVTLILTHRITPKDKIGLGMALYGISAIFAPALGPTIGGVLIEYHSWRMVFFINVPVCVVAVILAIFFLPRLPPTSPPAFDIWGFVAVGSASFALLLAISKASDWGWGGYRVLGLLTATVLLLAVFVVIELEVDHPLLDPRLFLNPAFSSCLVLTGILSAGYFAVLFYFPLFLQQGQHITAVNAGLVMAPEALAMGLASVVGGLLYDKIGPRWPTIIGLVIAGFGAYLMCQITWDLTRGDVIAWTVIRGFGSALAMVVVLPAATAAVAHWHADSATAFANLIYRVIAALGLSVLNSVAAHQQAQLFLDRSPAGDTAAWPGGLPSLLVLHQHLTVMVQADVLANLFLIIAVYTILGVPLALLLHSGRPTSTQGHAPEPEVGAFPGEAETQSRRPHAARPATTPRDGRPDRKHSSPPLLGAAGEPSR